MPHRKRAHCPQRLSRLVRFSVASCLLTICGCDQFVPHKFVTQATYEAPQSEFRIAIDASGVIEAGADAANGGIWKATVHSLGNMRVQSVAVYMVSESSAAFVVDSQDPVPVPWDFRSASTSFRQSLEAAGYTDLSDAELDEVVKAIECARSGPKCTLLPGQTTQLKAVEVSFD